MKQTIITKWMVAFVIGLSFAGVLASANAAELPKLITLVTNQAGAMQHTHSVAYAAAIEKVTGLRVKVESRNSEPEKIAPLRAGAAEIMTSVTVNSLNPAIGKAEFGSAQWGPQPLRIIHIENAPSPMALGVRADSGIKTGADIKGKRVAWYPTGAGRTLIVEAMLAFHGLTWNDVIRVPAAGFTQAQEALLDGRVDVSYANPSNPLAFRLAASPHGIQWIQMPLENKEGWDTYMRMTSGTVPFRLTFAANVSKESPLDCPGTLGLMLCFDNLSDEIAYAVAKGLGLGVQYYKDTDKNTEQETLGAGLKWNKYLVHPYHPGAIKFYKEQGLWNPEHEALQQQLLKKAAEIKASWKPN